MTDALLEQMRDPAFYPHEVTQDVHVVQTHISYVFLTGPYAYKIKKPVDLGFLDFTTLELRKHYCDEELRLNRRFAPSLYLDVVPIFPRDDRFSFEPPDPKAEPAEYALKMRQFREEDLLTHCLDRGEVTEDHMRQVAEKLVAAHAAAETNERIAAFGAPERIRTIMDENFDITERYVGRTIEREQFEAIRNGVYGVIDGDLAAIAGRARNGYTRECHGDLHLRNMCWFAGEIQFFDCIEFNEKYRYIDVMYELAFLAMDLEYRDAPALANVLVNAYLELSGDYGGATLLPMYMAVRALVRGNVSSILHDEPDVAAEERDHALESARQHFAYAARRVEANAPRLILVCGLSGVGKTSVARELAKRLGAIHLRSDVIRKHAYGVSLDERSTAIYSPEQTTATYRRLVEIAAPLLAHGWAVILDATFRDAAFRQDALRVARERHVPVSIVHLHAPPEVLAQRIRQRTADASDATPELLAEQAAQFEPFSTEERQRLLDIDATRRIPFDDLAGRLRDGGPGSDS